MLNFCYGGGMDKKKFLFSLLIIIFVVVTVGLRYLFIGTDLWYDEACSWYSAKQSFPFGIMDNLLHLDLQHTPLYFFLLHFWLKLFGDSEFALRSLSMVFGVLSVPFVYIVSKKIMSKTLAVMTLAVAAASPLLVLFSVEVRMYPLIVFFVLVSLNYLIDFEQKADSKSLIKLIAANLLIPYTLVGGILYNLSLALCYGVYLFKTKREVFKKYIKGLYVEFILLIPYFVLIFYYAQMRNRFVVKHEGEFVFFQLVDVVRNFFGSTLVANVYWPSVDPYIVNFAFTALVVIPCVYFVYGLVQGCKHSVGFMKTLYFTVFLNFVLALLFAVFEVNIFTVRYILYLLAPMFILAIYGLSKKISIQHLKVFILYFVISSVVFNINYSEQVIKLKTMAFKDVKIEAENLQFGVDDIVIMPFGADAPYYFRKLSDPRLFEFDFHKEARNPYNDRFYDKSQQDLMASSSKYGLIYDRVYTDKCFSDNFLNYFVNNINATVPSGRYVLIALYATDVNSLVSLEDLRKSVTSIQYVKDNCLEVLFKKYLYDIRALLDVDFVLINSYTKDNYSYLLLQKK